MRSPDHAAFAAVLLFLAFALAAACIASGGAWDTNLGTAGLLIAGFSGGLGFAIASRDHSSWPALAGYVIGTVLSATLSLSLIPKAGLLPTMLAVTFGGAAMVAFGLAMQRVWTTGETFRLESDWGGLGHGMGGWQLSVPATLVLCALAFASVSLGALLYSKPDAPPAGSPKPTDAEPGLTTPPVVRGGKH